VVEVLRFTTSAASAAALDELRRLVWSAFGDRFSEADWEHGLGGEHVVVRDVDHLVAHAAIVPRRIYVADACLRAGYVESVATMTTRRGEGLATLAMTEANAVIAGGFEIGVLSTSSHQFYDRIGWERWRGPTYVVTPGGRVRTEDEDAGIMVLRTGPSVTVDLTSAIACEARDGDDW